MGGTRVESVSWHRDVEDSVPTGPVILTSVPPPGKERGLRYVTHFGTTQTVQRPVTENSQLRIGDGTHFLGYITPERVSQCRHPFGG